MKRIAFGLAILVVGGASGLAAAPWSKMPSTAGDGYSEMVGTMLPTFDRAAVNPSNCYDACAAIWSTSIVDSAAKVADEGDVDAHNGSALDAPAATGKRPAI